MNLLDLAGPAFLQVYLPLLGGTVLVAFLIRHRLRQPGGSVPVEGFELSPYDIAFLAGREELAVNAVLAKLVHCGTLSVNSAERKLSLQGPLLGPVHPLEQAVHDALAQTEEAGGLSISEVRATVFSEAASIRGRLQEKGLVVTDEQARLARWIPFLLVLGVALFGVLKLWLGLTRDRPVGVLIWSTVLAVVFTWGWFEVYRSRLGDCVLQQLRNAQPALRTAVQHAEVIEARDVAEAVALYGVDVLAGGRLAELQTSLKPASSGAGYSDGTCGAGDGGGGGCGGCGGCGG